MIVFGWNQNTVVRFFFQLTDLVVVYYSVEMLYPDYQETVGSALLGDVAGQRAFQDNTVVVVMERSGCSWQRREGSTGFRAIRHGFREVFRKQNGGKLF